MDRRSPAYQALKEQRAANLWRALEMIVPDIRSRVVEELVASPLTHERYLRRPRGTYGAAVFPEDGSDLPWARTQLPGLLHCGDSCYPGERPCVATPSSSSAPARACAQGAGSSAVARAVLRALPSSRLRAHPPPLVPTTALARNSPQGLGCRPSRPAGRAQRRPWSPWAPTCASSASCASKASSSLDLLLAYLVGWGVASAPPLTF
jgi:hypothetical protein